MGFDLPAGQSGGGRFIDVFVSKNGNGQSNLFKALIESFRPMFAFIMSNCPAGAEGEVTN